MDTEALAGQGESEQVKGHCNVIRFFVQVILHGGISDAHLIMLGELYWFEV